jgi:hypothetical protein
LFVNHSSYAQLNVQSLINDAIINKKPEVILPNGGNKLTLRGSSATKLIFNYPINFYKNYAILIQSSLDVTLENIEIDFDPLPFTQGRVIRIDANKNGLMWLFTMDILEIKIDLALILMFMYTIQSRKDLSKKAIWHTRIVLKR